MWWKPKPQAPKRQPTLAELKRARDELFAEIANDPDIFDDATAKHAYAKVRSRYRKWFDDFIDRYDPTSPL